MIVREKAKAMQSRSSVRRRRFTLVAMSLGFAVVQLDVSVVNVALKPISASLGGGVSALQWIVSAYTLAFAALILSAGAVADRIGAKRVFAAGFGLFTLASVLCALALNSAMLIVVRAVQGLGAAILVPCSLALLNHEYEVPAERVRAVGLWAAGASAALAAGPLVGGILTAAFGWRTIFFINVPIGLFGLWLTARYARETTRSNGGSIDWLGQITAVITLAALAWATINAGSHGLTAAGVLVSYLVAALAAAGFVIFERRQARPMLPLPLFRSPTFSVMTGIGLLINIGFYGFIFVLSLLFQQAQHLSVLQTGLAFAPMTAAIFLGNVQASRLSVRIGWRRAIRAGLLVAAGGLGLLRVSAHTPYSAILVQLLAIGLGLGIVVPLMTGELLSAAPKSLSGVASGTLNTARQTGSVIGVALFGSLIANGRLVSGFHISLLIAAGLAVLSLLMTAYVPTEQP